MSKSRWRIFAGTAGVVLVGIVLSAFGGLAPQGRGTGVDPVALGDIYRVALYIWRAVLASMVTALLQYFVLRQRGINARWWILATAVGLVVGKAIENKLLQAGGLFGDADFVPFVIAVSAAVGTAQWLALRRHIPRSGWWILVNVVGKVGSLLLMDSDWLYDLSSARVNA